MKASPQAIGFYDLEKLSDCELSGLASKIAFAQWLPDELPTRAVIVGRFYHDLMESETRSRANNEDYEFVRSLISKYRTEIITHSRLRGLGDPGTWKEINDAAKSYLLSNFDHEQPTDSRRVKDKLYSKSGFFVGKPDLLFIAADNAELKEFKSSLIYSDGDLVQKHIRQLKFYAYLVFENFDVSSVTASLIGLAGHEAPIRISKDDAMQFGRESEAKVAGAWSRIRAAKHPGEVAMTGAWCKYCSLRPACNSFQNDQMSNAEFDGYRFLRGKLLEVSGANNAPIANFDGFTVTFPALTGVSSAALSALKGKRVLTTNCRGSSKTFEATIRSQVIEVSDD